jgi:WD40 repeat protein
MASFENENILKSIFAHLTLRKVKQIFNLTKSSTISKIILQNINYKSINKSLEKQKILLKTKQYVFAMAILPNGTLLILSGNTKLEIWDLDIYHCIKTIATDCDIKTVVMLSDSIILSTYFNFLQIRNIDEDLKLVKNILVESHYARYDKLLLLPNGLLALKTRYADSREVIIILDYKGNKIVKVIKEQYLLDFENLSNNRFVSIHNNFIHIWDLDQGYKCIKTIGCQEINLRSMLYVKERDLLITVYNDGIKFWEMSNYECVKMISGIYAYRFLALSGQFFAFTDAERIEIWRIKDFKQIMTLKGHEQNVTSLILLKDEVMVSGSIDGSVIIWNY